MNLIWHIAKKDLRRMALPVGCWLVFLFAGTFWFRISSPPGDGDLGTGVAGWTRLLNIWAMLLYGTRYAIGFILAGALVLEDPVFGTTQFWPTRPIANARLFGAKILSAVILFVLAPLAVLVPVWLGSGFTAQDL